MSIYTELEGLCFLALLLLFSSVTLSISQTPLASSYSRSTSVPLMTSPYAPPINDRKQKERRRGRGRFSKCFLSQNSRSKKINTLHCPYNLIMNFEFFMCFSLLFVFVAVVIATCKSCCWGFYPVCSIQYNAVLFTTSLLLLLRKLYIVVFHC